MENGTNFWQKYYIIYYKIIITIILYHTVLYRHILVSYICTYVHSRPRVHEKSEIFFKYFQIRLLIGL